MLVEQSGTGDLVAFVVRYMSCSACHHAYSADDVAVTRRSAGVWLLAATCPACHHPQEISAFDRLPYTQIPALGMASPPPLTPQDVLDWAAYLDQFKGDFTALLAPAG